MIATHPLDLSCLLVTRVWFRVVAATFSGLWHASAFILQQSNNRSVHQGQACVVLWKPKGPRAEWTVMNRRVEKVEMGSKQKQWSDSAQSNPTSSSVPWQIPHSELGHISRLSEISKHGKQHFLLHLSVHEWGRWASQLYIVTRNCVLSIHPAPNREFAIFKTLRP